ncbi:MAG TPA: DUF4255 domain-containing protein [Acidimicrobiales bacterium]|nr:DUF4255 domain-containing protein [Acidimicrobiales bacterium]
MSTGYGMAAVTAVLMARLDSRLSDADVQAAIGPVSVTAVPPDRIQSGNAEPNRLNVYLHHATPSAAWRNEVHPVRDGTGRRVARPPLALDLQYLVTAFGTDTFAAEILLGHAMAELHDHPLLDLASVADVLHRVPPDQNVPAAVVSSRLEQQGEAIRVAAVPVASEEMSRLWTALGAQYRATAAYLVGPLLVDPEEQAATALPVRVPLAAPETLALLTVEDVVLAPAGDGRPDRTAPVTATDRALVRGDGLGGLDVVVMVGPDPLAVEARRPDGVVVDLATAASLRPGPVAVQVLQGGLSRSNVVLAAVRPAIAPTRSGQTVNCAVAPPVGRAQRATLLLNQRNVPAGQVPNAYALPAPDGNGASGNAATSASIPFSLAGVAGGSYLVRLEVDGVASVLGTDAQGRYSSPAVNVP